MNTKRKSYSAYFKAKLVLKVLEGEKIINEIASKYEVLPISLKNWKKQFFENISIGARNHVNQQNIKYVKLIPSHFI